MKKFIDECPITVRSGHGGPGCVSFRREKYVPQGGPDGGDGGRGGDVEFVADSSVKTLYDIRRRKHFNAPNGVPGKGRNKSGEKGESIKISLPVGTLVRECEGGYLVIDLDTPGKRFLAAKGGKGGLGNQHFATSVHQVPRYAQPGLPGEEREFYLELRLIADVGLVGFPNAGKSTLLKALTRANPKIANYPFTTLNPNLGVANAGLPTQCIIADIPGIIEGASEGKGLGIEFLKHIERTRLLVLVVDFAHDDPTESERILLNELATFSSSLTEKPIIRVANKMDLPEAREKAALFPDFMPISAATHEGTLALLNTITERLSKLDKA
jgi:GTP-binding protein